MLDHVGIRVKDMQKSQAFYAKALAPLNYELLAEFDAELTGTVAVAGFAERITKKIDFWISQGVVAGQAHICFLADNRRLVDEFYQAAIAAGGADNGKPGTRAHYHPHYYGAFVLDPDGHNIEACCHNAQ